MKFIFIGNSSKYSLKLGDIVEAEYNSPFSLSYVPVIKDGNEYVVPEHTLLDINTFKLLVEKFGGTFG